MIIEVPEAVNTGSHYSPSELEHSMVDASQAQHLLSPYIYLLVNICIGFYGSTPSDSKALRNFTRLLPSVAACPSHVAMNMASICI